MTGLSRADSSLPRPVARMRRAGNSRSSPSQGGLSKYSTHGTKHNMYVSSPKKSIRGRRADGTVSGRLRTVCPRCDGLGSIFWETAHTYYAWYHEYSAWRASPAMVSLWVGRRGAPTLCAPRSIITPESAADVAGGGATLRRRAGISRSCPSQGSLSMYSTRDTKRNMYVPSPKNSIRVRSTEGTPCGGDPTHGTVGATASDRSFGR